MKHKKKAENRVENPQNMDQACSVGMGIKKSILLFMGMDHHKIIHNHSGRTKIGPLSAFSAENWKKVISL